MCIDRGYLMTIVESDSMLLVDIINRKVLRGRYIASIINQIWSLMHKGVLFLSTSLGKEMAFQIRWLIWMLQTKSTLLSSL
uniref:Putative ovule protein n=1 Tax=Solanum chacoense TaxID=4108 RepID=A0A0V0HQ01_SOLCH